MYTSFLGVWLSGGYCTGGSQIGSKMHRLTVLEGKAA